MATHHMRPKGVERPTKMTTHWTIVPKPGNVLGLDVLEHGALALGGIVAHCAYITISIGAY